MEPKFGIGLRRAHFSSVCEHQSDIDFLEIIPENFMHFGGRPRAALERARAVFPIVLHGVSLSIGGPDPLSEDYLRHLRMMVDVLEPPWFSDHLCYSSAFGVEYHDLLPLPFTREMVKHVSARVAHVQDRVRRPLLLENPSYYIQFPGEMSEAEFISEVVKESGCGLLLDVNNVYVNAHNHQYDPRAFIDALPLEAVKQMHMAGHDASESVWIDTHGEAICEDVFELYRYVTSQIGATWTLLERDNSVPGLPELIGELHVIRAMANHAPRTAG